MKKTVLTTIVLTVLLSVLLLASCDSESLGNIRRFNLGYAGDYAVEEAQTATRNLVNIFDGFVMPSTTTYGTAEGKEKIDGLRALLSEVAKAVENIKNGKDVESDIRTLLAGRVANVNPGTLTSNHFNFIDFAEKLIGSGGATQVLKLIVGADTVGDDTYATIEEKYGIYPDVSLAVSPNSVINLAQVAINAYGYKPDGALKTRMQELIDNLSSGDQAGNEELKKVAKSAAKTLSNKIIRPMENRYNDGYLTYADYIFTALFADIVYTFHDLMYDLTVPMNEKIARTDAVARIIGYIGTIEYIYDVDFGIVDIINSMIKD